MDVSSVAGASLPDPGYFSSSPALPTGLAYGAGVSGAANATGSAAAAGSQGGTSAAAGTSTGESSSTGARTASGAGASTSSTVSPYATAYATLQQDEAAELLQVSLGSPSAAEANVSDVLAQWAALQAQEDAAQHEAAAAAAVATPAASATGAMNVPSYESIVTQSDQDALGATAAQDGLGASSSASAASGTGTPNPTGTSIDTLA